MFEIFAGMLFLIYCLLVLAVTGLTLFMVVASVGIWFDDAPLSSKIGGFINCLLSIVVGSMGMTLGYLTILDVLNVL